jgi:hypothetical protein
VITTYHKNQACLSLWTQTTKHFVIVNTTQEPSILSLWTQPKNQAFCHREHNSRIKEHKQLKMDSTCTLFVHDEIIVCYCKVYRCAHNGMKRKIKQWRSTIPSQTIVPHLKPLSTKKTMIYGVGKNPGPCLDRHKHVAG